MDGLGSDDTFDDIRTQLDAAVDQEALEDLTERHGVTQHFSQLRLTRFSNFHYNLGSPLDCDILLNNSTFNKCTELSNDGIICSRGFF